MDLLMVVGALNLDFKAAAASQKDTSDDAQMSGINWTGDMAPWRPYTSGQVWQYQITDSLFFFFFTSKPTSLQMFMGPGLIEGGRGF